MNALAELQAKVDAAEQRVVKLEQLLAQNPELFSVAANLRTATRIRKELQAQLAEAVVSVDHGVRSYPALGGETGESSLHQQQ